MQNKRVIGADNENKAVKFLKNEGYIIITQNYRCRLGEIDIIAKDGDYLVFIEVKYRRNNKKGDPSEAVNYYKQRTITKVAQNYMAYNNISMYTPCRFDVVVFLDNEFRLIKNAFSAV